MEPGPGIVNGLLVAWPGAMGPRGEDGQSPAEEGSGEEGMTGVSALE